MTIALLDLGSNTFNLLIAAPDDEALFKKIYSAKLPARLGEGGYEENIITSDAFHRGMAALENHLQKIQQFRCDKIFAFGTAALRSASNGKEFTDTVAEKLGINVQIIDGDTEAELIYHGVQLAINLGTEPVVIMDIGGGSTEFIVASQQEIFWKKSYALGAAKLHQWLKPNDPITPEEQLKLADFLGDELAELKQVCAEHNVKTLVGSSGSFDSLADMISHELHGKKPSDNLTDRAIDLKDFELIKERILRAHRESRLKMRGLPKFRVDLIIPAVITVDVVLKTCGLQAIRVSEYALKEGILHQVLKGKL